MYDSFNLKDVYEKEPERIARLVGKTVTVKLFDGDGALNSVGVGKLTLAVVTHADSKTIEAVQLEDGSEALHTARDTTWHINIAGETE